MAVLFHDPDWDTYVVGVERPLVADPVGVADIHKTLGDVTAGLVLWTTAWLSYRIFAKISLTGIVMLGFVVGAVLTGNAIRVNAVIRNGVTDADARGYTSVFRGDFDYWVAGSADLEPLVAAVWTAAHLATLPLALALIWAVYYRSLLRIQRQPAADPSWLDQMDT